MGGVLARDDTGGDHPRLQVLSLSSVRGETCVELPADEVATMRRPRSRRVEVAGLNADEALSSARTAIGRNKGARTAPVGGGQPALLGPASDRRLLVV